MPAGTEPVERAALFPPYGQAPVPAPTAHPGAPPMPPPPVPRSSTETLIAALRILAAEIQSPDGLVNAAIAEAADRLEELAACRAALALLVGEDNAPALRTMDLYFAHLILDNDAENQVLRQAIAALLPGAAPEPPPIPSSVP